MKKNDVIKARKAYKAVTITMSDAVHTRPVLGDGIDRGREGKTFESEVKSYIGNYSKATISKQGRTDCTITLSNGKRVKCEIKNGGGELATINADGSMKWGFSLNGMIIYAPTYTPEQPVETQAYVFNNAEEFVNALASMNLIRNKYSTAMNRRAKADRYHDKITIQSLSSTGRYNKMYDYCEECGTLLANWER